MIPMRIAMIAPDYLPIPAVCGGAIETLVENIAEENEKYGNLKIDIYCVGNDEAKKRAMHYKRTRFLYFCPKPWKNFLYRALRKTLNVFTFYQYLMPLFPAFIAACKIKKGMYDAIVIEGCPEYVPVFKNKSPCMILHVHTDLFYKGRKSAKKILNCCNAVYTVSDYVNKRVCGIDDFAQNDKVFTLKNCVNTQLFCPDEHKTFRKTFRNENGISPHDTVYVFCGRVDVTKGVLELVQAFAKLNRDDAWLLIIGGEWFNSAKETPFITQLKNASIGKKEKIIFTGYVSHSELPAYYSAADIAILPSRCYDAAPLSVIEAISMGLPLITTMRGGIPEYASGNALLLDADKDLEAQLFQAMLLPKESFPGSDKTREQFRELHNTQQYYLNFCELLQRTLKGILRNE